MAVGIIGGGIAGLTAAHVLKQEGVDVRVLEATDRTGGMIRTEHTGGYLVEHGPNSLRATTPLLTTVIRDLGLDDAVVEATSEATKRYVVRDQQPQALPSSLGSFLTTSLLSLRGKLRLLAEPFIRRGASSDTAESVAAFVQRRLGNEILDYAVDPFVGGIFAGDPEQLSLKHAFERLHDMEQEHGSLFRGMISAARSRSKDDASTPRTIFSFRNGLQTLTDALTEALGDAVSLSAPVEAMRLDDNRWHVATQEPGGATQMHFFDAVVCTAPLYRLAAIDFNCEVDLAPLEHVPYPPVSVLALGFDREDVGHPLDGFGMLVPSVEDDFNILGTLFSSTLFPGRAPEGKVLLTTFVGGSRHPELGETDTSTVRSKVMQDLRSLLDVHGEPSFVRHVQWARAIPQYTLGYDQVQAVIEQIETNHPGLFLAGNYRSGISVGDAMDSGAAAAEEALAAVQSVAA
jgi:oxygen-dependent protoporphyrinogen oxidase